MGNDVTLFGPKNNPGLKRYVISAQSKSIWNRMDGLLLTEIRPVRCYVTWPAGHYLGFS